MILTGIPYLEKVRSRNNLRDVRRWHIPTDEGIVTIEQYAKAFGLKVNAATSRIHRLANGLYTLEQAMMPPGKQADYQTMQEGDTRSRGRKQD